MGNVVIDSVMSMGVYTVHYILHFCISLVFRFMITVMLNSWTISYFSLGQLFVCSIFIVLLFLCFCKGPLHSQFLFSHTLRVPMNAWRYGFRELVDSSPEHVGEQSWALGMLRVHLVGRDAAYAVAEKSGSVFAVYYDLSLARLMPKIGHGHWFIFRI